MHEQAQIDRAYTMKDGKFLSATSFGEKKNQELWVKCSHVNIFIKGQGPIWNGSSAFDISN